jgi:2-dehydropantoate 2-reductase
MKIAVLGAGALGGYCGAMLKPNVDEVIFIARGQHLKAMQQNGLIVHSSMSGSHHVRGIFTDDFKALLEADLIIFTVNSIQTADTAARMLPYLKPDSIILTLQNGVDNEEKLAAVLGSDRVLSGASYITVHLESPGIIRQENIQTFILGPLSDNGQIHVELIMALFNKSGLACTLSPNILETKWEKFLNNAAFNPLCALTQKTIGGILDDDTLRSCAASILMETVLIARGLGVNLKQEAINEVFPQSMVVRNHKPSMLQHREQGKKMEVESLCGYLIQKGNELGIKTPILEHVYHSLLAINDSLK